jgi:hypothetical protein
MHRHFDLRRSLTPFRKVISRHLYQKQLPRTFAAATGTAERGGGGSVPGRFHCSSKSNTKGAKAALIPEASIRRHFTRKHFSLALLPVVTLMAKV